MVELYPFQKADTKKLAQVESRLIANEMGTGKTYEAIELDKYCGGRTLVVAPLSNLHSTWEKTFSLMQPDRKITVINPRRRSQFVEAINAHNGNGVFIAHWESLRLSGMDLLCDKQWGHIIADEAHRIRNRKTQQTKALKRIPAVHKTALTGTPIVNRPDDLWSVLHWLYPKKFPSYWKFFNTYVKYRKDYFGYIEIIGPKNSKQLMSRIRPYYVRRLKSEVMSELPPKYYTPITVPLTPKQNKAYHQMRKDMLVQLDNEQQLVAPSFIAKLVRLQQFANAYHNGDGLIEPSSKIDALMEILNNTTRPVVVFSMLREVIKLVEARLVAGNIDYVRIVGEDSAKAREQAVSKFATGQVPVFLGTIGAGSEGISLTASDTCVFLDRSWTPADNWQAEDRLHRGGQQNAVQVITINAENTIDQYKKYKLTNKKSMIRMMLESR